jgi:hypothetical protein
VQPLRGSVGVPHIDDDPKPRSLSALHLRAQLARQPQHDRGFATRLQ